MKIAARLLTTYGRGDKIYIITNFPASARLADGEIWGEGNYVVLFRRYKSVAGQQL